MPDEPRSGNSLHGRSRMVEAELVGTVLQVLVAEGQQVRAGDKIVIIESMKMEIPVLTEVGGIVRITVSVGDNVQEGDTLAVVDYVAD